jgi:hypothetical protein
MHTERMLMIAASLEKGLLHAAQTKRSTIIGKVHSTARNAILRRYSKHCDARNSNAAMIVSCGLGARSLLTHSEM